MRMIVGKNDIQKSSAGELQMMTSGVAQPQQVDSYNDRLVKYIPAEVVAVYLALDTIVRSSAPNDSFLYWLIFAFCIIATVLYLWRIQHVTKYIQILLSTGAFIVWVYAMGGPFISAHLHNPTYGAVILVIYTFLIPIIEPSA